MSQCNLIAVDDEVQNLNAIERALRQENCINVIKLSDPFEALELLRSQPVHILIADQKMPKMNGIELLQKALEISPNTVRIMLTAYANKQDILDSINLGRVYSYLTKPWKPDDLRQVVKQALQYYELTSTNQSLARELKEKNRMLQKKNVELTNFNELKNRFMLVASHELRTPATILTGALELLRERQNGIEPDQKKLLQNALNGAYRLNEIIETFFEAVRWNSGETALEETLVDIKSMLILVVDRFKPFWKERGLDIGYNLGNKLFVLGDQKKLYLVFENLLSNAIKYTPDRGQILINSYLQGKNVVVVFEDNGIGIPSSELDNIFTTFYQLGELKYHHTSRHEFRGGGTGLGLSLCRSIINAHGGKIYAESKGENQGSSFFIVLPAAKSK